EDRLQRPVVVRGGDDVPRHERRDQREHPHRSEEQQDERDCEPGLVDVSPEGDVVRLAVLRPDGHGEDDRDSRGGAQPEVRPLLEAQLAQLPAVDGEHPRSHVRSPITAGTPASRGPAPFAPSPSVSAKKRSSSVAWCGESSRISAPASASASDRAATRSSAAARKLSPLIAAGTTSSIPSCPAHTRSARASSVVTRRYVVPAARRSSARAPS